MIRTLALAVLLASPAAAQQPPLSLVMSTLADLEPMHVIATRDGREIWAMLVQMHPQDCARVAAMFSGAGVMVECRRVE